MNVTARPGFTLLEMLISVAIFSGLVILILAIFVRTASSQARVNTLREKSEIARSAMASLTNDFQYAYYDREVVVLNRFNGGAIHGFHVETNTVGLLLRYPNKSESDLVFKQYRARPIGGSKSAQLEVEEFRGCTVQPNGQLQLENDCRDSANTNGYRQILPNGFLLDDRGASNPIFSGLSADPDSALTGYAKIALTIKPADFGDYNCHQSSVVPAGTCYKVETILTAGGVN